MKHSNDIIMWMKITFVIFLIPYSVLGQFYSSGSEYNSGHSEDTIKKKNILLKSCLAIAYAGTTYSVYKLGDSYIQHESQELRGGFLNQVNFGLSILGLGKTNWISCGATFAASYLTTDKKLQKTAVLWAGSLIVSDFFTTKLKYTTQRYRPDTGDPYNTFDWANGPGLNNSFPSAHTSNSFATATVFATMYKNKKWVPPLAYGIATLIGLSRVYANAHWMSDVMAGAAVGFLSAKGVIGLFKLIDKKVVLIIPQIGEKYNGIKFYYRF